MFGIFRHCSQFKITIGLPFAHGSQKRWILATLYRLSLSQFGENPGQVPSVEHARPFQLLAWLQRFFKNRSCQGLPPIPCCSRRHPNNGITPSGLFEHLFTSFGLSNAAQTFQRMMDRTTDSLEGVFAYMDDSCFWVL